MEKICEFCAALRPVVYCKADAAYLCLSCDAKVHSANALSNRHFRTLLCEFCRHRSAYVRCLDHRMFMCRGCDRNLHEISSQHQKQVISNYMGCPSAKDFAALWGFELNELDNGAFQDQILSTPHRSVESVITNLRTPTQSSSQLGSSSLVSSLRTTTLVFGVESEGGSSSRHCKGDYKSKQQQNSENTNFILQQILDLKRLQLGEGKNSSSLMRGQKQAEVSLSKFNTLQKLNEDLDQHLQNLSALGTDHQQLESSQHEPKVEFPLPFSQLENLPGSSTAAIPSNADSFWQCKSPVQSNELWSQNLQDLGVCEEVDVYDDFNMPDVDITFRNFEELFGGDQDPTRMSIEDKYVVSSSMEKDASFDMSENFYTKVMEDTSVVSSVNISQAFHADGNSSPIQAHHDSGSMGSPHPIRPYSPLSFSFSRLSAKSSGTDYLDGGLSPFLTRGEPLSNSSSMESAHSEARENAVMRYKEKKKVREKNSLCISES
ncbi:putative zinc finger protein At1g68190 isoform X2 [Malania oleifera]|uniref:putative zinc finger protein At1g68190 isoform X2 n=1 Tax=Malania oleifera TaxID=397392 RepID=UPI0025AEBC85|nr:putative zinc finger protein At1g68190 isoform X2 [Malania oleifera]XP_057963239.1 putative zinc finger protein At1g68190 isoform X2 [Malania oleifera]XP_057963240.1 putative zinc finger protein At1g68190 isoform X2 [Malania oleifera]